MDKELWKSCREMQDEIVRLRRQLHRIPETGTHLPLTQEAVVRELESAGIPFFRSSRDSSLRADIQGGSGGKTVVFRADMDALPIKEDTGVSYASLHEGKMHACGHDSHVAMLLAAARVLQSGRDCFQGTVRLIFQSGEETSEGARNVIEEGWLDGADAAFGLHIGPVEDSIPSGAFVAVPGACLASVDRFRIQIKGAGCHCSMPHKGKDPVVMASHVVLALQNILSREIPATEAAALSVGTIRGGEVFNAIPDTVELEGSLRALGEDTRRLCARRIEEIAAATASVFGGSAHTELAWGTPPLRNDPVMAELAAGAAAAVAGEEKAITALPAPKMGGDDFACYLSQVPGAYVFFSSHGNGSPIHSARFTIDEEILWQGAAFWVELSRRFLSGQ